MQFDGKVALALAGAFIENPIVRRALCSLAKHINTPELWGTQIDDWAIRILYGADALPEGTDKVSTVNKALNKVQEIYDTAKMKAETTGDSSDLDALKAPRRIEVGDFQWPWEFNSEDLG